MNTSTNITLIDFLLLINTGTIISVLIQAKPNLNGIYDLTVLDQVLSEKGLPTIEGAVTTQGSQPGNNNNTTDATLPDVLG